LEKQKGFFFGIVPEENTELRKETRKASEYVALLPDHVQHKDDVHVRLVSEQVDYGLLKSWISICEGKHQRCKPKPLSHRPWRLIDCRERTMITETASCSYVALSYVWGNAPVGETSDKILPENVANSLSLPSNVPAVVQDAMEVTLKLGERYLWIDKYCINHHDLTSERTEIAAMDLIYEQARVAIFAAAGLDEKFGLIGVNDKRREKQTTTIINGVQLASTLRHPLETVKTSKWCTRAWTHQEALLSHRRLFFTEEQVYFICNGMECWESLNVSLPELHKRGTDRVVGLKREFQLYSDRPRARLWDFLGHVREYSGRKLSDPADSFNAFKGIAHKFATDCKPLVNNLWGLPIVSGRAVQSFTHALTWVHKAEDNPEGVRRRPNFPSYSFVGWEGKIYLEVERNLEAVRGFQVSNVEIEVVVANCHPVRLDSLERIRDKDLSEFSTQLRIKACLLRSDIWTKPASTDRVKDMYFEVMARLPSGERKCRVEVSDKMNSSEFLEGMESGQLHCLLLGFVDKESRNFSQPSRCHSVMIVRGDLEETVERVGILSIICPSHKSELLGRIREKKHLFRFDSGSQPEKCPKKMQATCNVGTDQAP
jgi:hypothetical protein